MAPLLVQLVMWTAFWLVGQTGLFPPAATAVGALRFALAVMFAFTAASHFLPRTRGDLIRMVPPVLGSPAALVTLTGVLELLGAVGLLLPPTTWLAALGLAALLVAMFPANVYAAQQGLSIAGRRATPLWLRLPLQIFWIACLLRVGVAHAPADAAL